MKKTELKTFIKEVVRYIIRENWEPFDAETNTFASAPRDRSEPSTNNLGISEYPEAVIRQHNMDGKIRWFVYSSSDPQALILGYGKSSENAVANAKTTAKFIKQGGVGHTGELKEEEHIYDERAEIKLINSILVEAQNALKKTNSLMNQDISLSLKEISRLCIELLKMHGAK